MFLWMGKSKDRGVEVIGWPVVIIITDVAIGAYRSNMVVCKARKRDKRWAGQSGARSAKWENASQVLRDRQKACFFVPPLSRWIILWYVPYLVSFYFFREMFVVFICLHRVLAYY